MYLFLSDFNEILNFSWQLLASLSCQIIKRICPTTGSDIRSHRWNGMTSYSIFFYYVKNALKSNHDYLNTTSSNRKTNVFSKQITTTKTRYQQSLLYMTFNTLQRSCHQCDWAIFSYGKSFWTNQPTPLDKILRFITLLTITCHLSLTSV